MIQQLTPAEWSARYRRLRDIADRVQAMRHARYVALCRAAHVSPGCVLGNALIGAEQGKPWREVDYSKARAARRVERSLFEASDVVSRWDRRVRGYSV